MPIPGAKYRYKKGTKLRLAYDRQGNVVEVKNMATGDTHTPTMFKADKKRAAKKAQKRTSTKRRGGK